MGDNNNNGYYGNYNYNNNGGQQQQQQGNYNNYYNNNNNNNNNGASNYNGGNAGYNSNGGSNGGSSNNNSNNNKVNADSSEFANYIPNTNDPGASLMFGTLLICGALLLATLSLIAYIQARQRRRTAEKAAIQRLRQSQALDALRGDNDHHSSNSTTTATDTFLPQTARQTFEKRVVRRDGRRVVDVTRFLVTPTHNNNNTPTESTPPIDALQKDLFDQGGPMDQMHGYIRHGDALCANVNDDATTFTELEETTSDVNSEYVLMWKDDGQSSSGGGGGGGGKQKRPISDWTFLWKLFQMDRESKKLLKLAIPYSATSALESIFGLLTMGAIGQLLGTRELSAYVTVYYAVGITTMFLEGLLSSLTTLCSQAIGLGNFALAGRYVQISVVCYIALYIPQIMLWWTHTYTFMIWMEFDEEAALLGQSYARVYLFHVAVEAIHSALVYLLEVCGHENFVALFNGVHGGICLGIIMFFLLLEDIPYIGKPTLQLIAAVELVFSLVFLMVEWRWANWLDWLTDYKPGIFASLCTTDLGPFRNFVQVAFPLSIGFVLSYGEWETLFILTSYLGPAEVAAWGILGEIWEALEGLTTAWGDAAEVRCATLLGSGDALRAQLSCYKALVMGLFCSAVVSVLLLLFKDVLPTFITADVTLQRMITDAFPLLCLGNIALTLGTLSWQLVGAQNRYSLATAVELVGSWLVTLPLAALSVFFWRWDLSGLVAAVVVGCMVSGMLNFAILRCTRWEKIVKRVQKSQNDEGGDEEEPGSYTRPTVELSQKVAPVVNPSGVGVERSLSRETEISRQAPSVTTADGPPHLTEPQPSSSDDEDITELAGDLAQKALSAISSLVSGDAGEQTRARALSPKRTTLSEVKMWSKQDESQVSTKEPVVAEQTDFDLLETKEADADGTGQAPPVVTVSDTHADKVPSKTVSHLTQQQDMDMPRSHSSPASIQSEDILLAQEEEPIVREPSIEPAATVETVTEEEEPKPETETAGVQLPPFLQGATESNNDST